MSIFEKNAILITHYTPCDKERMRFSSKTYPTQWLATTTVNRKWRLIEVLLFSYYWTRATDEAAEHQHATAEFHDTSRKISAELPLIKQTS
jgi:hypothetical protein